MSELSRKRSSLWMNFSVASAAKARCHICKQLLSYKRGTTSNLRKHLAAKHPSVLAEEMATKVSAARTQDATTDLLSSPDSKLAISQIIEARDIVPNPSADK